MAAFEDFPDRPMPLVEVSDDKSQLSINPEAAALLARVDCVLCPIAIVGLYRTGKSSLLNFLNGKQRGFKVGPSVSRCTRGVWIYGKPKTVTLGDGSTCAVVLLDTEGVGGLEADAQYDTRIFALATLMCAGLVYNSLGSIDENAIGQLSFVAQLSKHVRFKKPAALEDEDDASEDAARLAAFMPSFTWVLRDFALELVDERGDAITSDEYLEQALKPQRGYEASVLERNRVRHMLTAFFGARRCATLVRPVSDEKKLQQIDELDASELRPEFARGMEDLRDSLFAPENVKPKAIDGSPLRGATYVALLEQYVDAVNSGGVPVISSAWDHVSAGECASALTDAFAPSRRRRRRAPPCEQPLLDRDVEAALGAAFAAFDARAVGDAKAAKRDELREKTSDFRRDRDAANDRASHAACDELLSALYMDVVWADLAKIAATVARGESEVGASDVDLTANLEQTWTELRRRYNAAARHESAVREEHDRLVGVKAQLAELEGTMAARGRMLEDCQATLISTQFEKARHEARFDAAEKRLKDQDDRRKKDRAAYDANIKGLELKLQRAQNDLDAANERRKLDARAGDDPSRPQPVNQPCNCAIA
ncbi:GTPase [Aureococcus anophagefferens]|nr:GTPase [Aureococcus anophagefferens]